MSCDIPSQILHYIELVEADTPRACPEQHALAALVRKVFKTEDIWVDTELLQKYLGIEKYFAWDLLPWEIFLTGLWNCTFRANGLPRWKTVFCMVGRGAGKDGYIAFDGACMISPYNPVDHYNVDICANNEEQAVTPVKDLAEVLENPKYEAKLKKHYYHTKELVQGRKNKGVMKGRTNNPSGRDGMRSGKIVFNEAHQYENYKNIKVFRTGLGKVAQPREGFFTSNGDVSDGPLDDLMDRSMRILFEGETDDGFLPFICRLPSVDAVHDPENWYMANPSLFYFPHLLEEIRGEYRDWCQRPEENGDFLTKRMGIRTTVKDLAVTDYTNIKSTNKPLPDLGRRSCTVGIDYAELSDWAAVNLHFRIGEMRYDINHAWVCRHSKTLHRVRAPWQKWADEGHITVVDEESIHPDLLAAYIKEAGKRYDIKKIAADHFRWTLISQSLKAIGFDVSDKKRTKRIRPSDIMQTDPVIQHCFDHGLFCWGDVPHLRWAVNNAKRIRFGRKQGEDIGNFVYAKIEAKSRKTDPFMALVASMTIEDVLGTGEMAELPPIGAIKL